MDRIGQLCHESTMRISFGLDELDENPEEFYFPNMCHVCRCFGENVNLKRCGACQMISYCCRQHQEKDWPSHKKFCNVICRIKKNWKVESVFHLLKSKTANTSHNKHDYRFIFHSLLLLHVNISHAAAELLERKLTKIEYQMIMFPRLCAVCCESNSKLLVNCKTCPLASFCKQHLNDPNHENECAKIVSCFNSVSSGYVLKNNIWTFEDISIDSHYYPADKNKKLPSSMLQFIEMRSSTDLIHFGSSIEDKEIRSTILKRLLSERFSRSFTILFAIEKLGLNDLQSMVIHVVGSSDEEHRLSYWELIFHFLPQLHKLELIFIGPELSDLQNVHQFCNRCAKDDRKLLMKAKKTFYHEYCKDDSFLKPDMMVCFNPGFHVYGTWKESIKAFDKGQCPLLVTSVQKAEGLFDKSFIDSTFPFARCIYCDDNPFTCIPYHRQTIHLPVGANNHFLTIYEFLDEKQAQK